jgi:hypothetical protein
MLDIFTPKRDDFLKVTRFLRGPAHARRPPFLFGRLRLFYQAAAALSV